MTAHSSVAAQKIAPSSYLITVKKFSFAGNTVYIDEQLETLLEKYIDIPITIDKLHEAKEIISRFYISNGYVNSGAILPDQQIDDGLVELQIIEGTLNLIKIKEGSRFHSDYITGRINQYNDSPLHMPSLQLPLYYLHNDPLINTIHAELKPTGTIGQGELYLELKEASPYTVSMGFNNHRSPNIGDLHRYVNAEVHNLTGWNEVTRLEYGNTNGLRDYATYFSIPINYQDTRLFLSYQDSASTIINDVVKDKNLDIDSTSQCFDIGLRHPVYRDRSSELALSLKLTLKKSETIIAGFPFEDGQSRNTIISFAQEWINRSPMHALTVRSTLSFGTTLFNAAIVDHSADGEFVSWLGQIQWLHRLPFLHSNLLFKTNLRLSDDTLPPSEKFAVGGYSSVRGYRENSLTGDQGFTTGIELQMMVANLKCPGLSDGPEDGDLYLIPFADFGKSWNKAMDTKNTDIGSVGLGLRWLPRKNSRIEIFWGHALRELPKYGQYSLQDDGIHFNLTLTF